MLLRRKNESNGGRLCVRAIRLTVLIMVTTISSKERKQIFVTRRSPRVEKMGKVSSRSGRKLNREKTHR